MESLQIDVQLTKDELKNLEEGSIIIEKLFNETNIWKISRVLIRDSKHSVFQLVEINTKNYKKLNVSENFNKEGDRRYNSPHGSVIVKYYRHDSI